MAARASDADSDEAMAALEKHLDFEHDDPFALTEACMEVAEFAAKIKENKEKLVVLLGGTELSDADAKTLVGIIPKASAVEGISLDGIEASTTALSLVIAAVEKNGKLKYLNLSSLNLEDPFIKIFSRYLESTTTLEYLNLLFCDVKPTGAQALMAAIEKNTSLTNIIPPSDDDDKVVHFLEGIIARNKKRKAPPAASAKPAVASSHQLPNNTPAASNGSRPITVWVKGQVHFGEAPPEEPGWMRLTFDAGTTFNAAPKAPLPVQPDFTPAATPTLAAPAAAAAAKPASAATVVKKSSEEKPPSSARPQAPLPPTQTSSSVSGKAPPPAASSAAATKKRSGMTIKFRCQAVYNYVAQDEDEASFKKGDLIDVYKVEDEDWYMGKVESTGASGQIPSNHVKIIEKFD